MLEDNSTLIGKNYAEKKGGVCIPNVTSSLCVPILDNMFDVLESSSDLSCEDTLDEVILRDTFVYYLFAYDDDAGWVVHLMWIGVYSGQMVVFLTKMCGYSFLLTQMILERV